MMEHKPDTSDCTRILAAAPLFAGCAERTLLRAAEGGYVCVLKKGGCILSRGSRPDSLGFLLSGTAQVRKPSGGNRIILSTLGEGDMFGAAVLFSDSGFTNDIVAETACRIFCLSRETVRELMASDPAVSENYIRYLSGRISFLNARIESFTAGGAEARLAEYLAAACDAAGKAEIPYSMTELAEVLSVGRASLYRAMDSLERSGFLKKSGKNIVIRKRDA